MRHLALALLAAGVIAGEAPAPVPAPPPAPGPAAGPASAPPMRMPMVGRGSTTYEVEQLSIIPGDPAGLAAWAEHAARGWHLVTVAVQPDGKQVLFFERPMQPGGEPYIPVGVAADQVRAQALRETIKRLLAERLPQRRPEPQPAPAPTLPEKAAP